MSDIKPSTIQDPEAHVDELARSMGVDLYQDNETKRNNKLISALAVTGFIAFSSTVGLIAQSTMLSNNVDGTTGEAAVNRAIIPADDLNVYLPGAYDRSLQRIQDAINPANSIKGSLVAALSGTCPNYAYTWVRDQALVFQVALEKYENLSPGEAQQYEQNLKDYASFTHDIFVKNQGKRDDENKPWTLFDTKYERSGDLFRQPWCDPQSDGPAMRVNVLMRFAERYLEINNGDAGNYLKENVVNGNVSSGRNPVLRDLLYLKDNWNVMGCEPWEEVFGQHFYNKIHARRAFKKGSEFIRKYGDAFGIDLSIADQLDAQVGPIEAELDSHWRGDLKTIVPTKNNGARFDDIQTVLATIHSYSDTDGDNYYPADSERVLANVVYTMKSFENMYSINNLNWNNVPSLGVAIGRYAGDIYNGFCPLPESICPYPCLGQPWFLATHAIAELLYKVVIAAERNGFYDVNGVNKEFYEYFGSRGKVEGKSLPFRISKGSADFNQVSAALIHAADAQMKRSAYHSGNNFQMDEQYNADTGLMMSAGDLTWSYGSLVTAVNQRNILNVDDALRRYTPSGSVEVEVIVSGVPSFQPSLTIVGNTAELGNWNPCNGVPAYYRRQVNGVTEWSTFITVPKGSAIEFKAAVVSSTGSDCEIVSWAGGDNTKFSAGDVNPLNAEYVIY